MKKKTKYIIILSAVIVLLAGGNAVYALTHDGEEKTPDERKIEQTEEQTTEQTEADKLDSHEQDNYAKEENQKDVTEHGQQSATTQQPQTPQPTNTSPATNSGGNSGNTVTEAPQPTSTPPTSNNCGNGANTSPQTPTAPSGNNTTIVPEPTTAEIPIPTTTEHTPVWVVDQAAWDEEIPIYEDRCRGVCYGCGAYMYSRDEIVNHRCPDGSIAGWYDDWYQVQIGTEIVHHDEVGHWE